MSRIVLPDARPRRPPSTALRDFFLRVAENVCDHEPFGAEVIREALTMSLYDGIGGYLSDEDTASAEDMTRDLENMSVTLPEFRELMIALAAEVAP